MRQMAALACFWAGLVLSAAIAGARADGAEPVRLIFDTDMDTDCDDAGALAMLHALADEGKVEILATMVSSHYPYSAPCVEAINRYYGRPDLPIGVPKGKGAPIDRGSRYARQIAREFPTTLETNADAPDAARLYRKVLAAHPDGEVVIVTVGYLTNLRDLLATGADEHSPLAGPELVRRKVKHYVCMGGRYPRHLDPGVFGNLKPDPDSAVAVARDWPTTIYFSGLGDDVMTGEPLRAAPADHPVRRAYELYLGERPTRPSWDQIAALFAILGAEPYWQLRREGHNHIFPNGTNEWRAEPDDPRHVLVEWKDRDARDACRTLIDELMARGRRGDRAAAARPPEDTRRPPGR
jgi:hypothetical protein